LRDLEKINPCFYPKPVFISGVDKRVVKNVELHEEGALT
jgi:hypothetical protein